MNNTHASIDVEGNHLLGSPQAGIVIARNDPQFTIVIRNNEFRQNAVTTNGYALLLSAAQHFEIAGNTIVPDNGKGIDLDGYVAAPLLKRIVPRYRPPSLFPYDIVLLVHPLYGGSFPSGHTASSFASAWILASVWPRRAPVFFSLAGIVGFSRIYLGAHYPGDVASGAMAGTVLSEVTRRLIARLSG